MKTDRVQAFSDGVFAILITILVLEFSVPAYKEGRLFAAVVQQWPTFFAYVMTFTYIGILWLFHHDLFASVDQTNARLNILNLLSIFLTTLLSYSMSLLAESLVTMNRADLRFSIAFYALLALGISQSYFWIYSYLSKNPWLLSERRLAKRFLSFRRYPLISSAVYLLALAGAFVSVPTGFIFLIAGIVFHYYAYWRSAKLINQQ
jgi:uncharacterized membrane protein